MNIGGFEINKTVFITICVALGAIAVFSISSYSSDKARKDAAREQAQRDAEEAERLAAMQTEEIDYDAQLQQQLVEQYGPAPEGFKWDVLGNLVAIGTDAMTAEDIVYTFTRALSVLDFSTAQRYSIDSSVVSTYQNYYSEITKDITDYYEDFLRKQYKTALTSLEINDVKDTAVFADGTENVTLNIKVLDLTDKDFWRKDKKELFKNMRTYDRTEDDDTKKDQYVYNYLLKAYENGKVPKRSIDIELVVSKDNGGGWLVTNDGELNSTLSYEWGLDIAEYIKKEYDKWSLEKDLNEY